MEAFECGKEACSAGRAANGALDSDLGHCTILPLTCGLFGYMACISDPTQAAHNKGTYGEPGRSEAGIS